MKTGSNPYRRGADVKNIVNNQIDIILNPQTPISVLHNIGNLNPTELSQMNNSLSQPHPSYNPWGYTSGFPTIPPSCSNSSPQRTYNGYYYCVPNPLAQYTYPTNYNHFANNTFAGSTNAANLLNSTAANINYIFSLPLTGGSNAGLRQITHYNYPQQDGSSTTLPPVELYNGPIPNYYNNPHLNPAFSELSKASQQSPWLQNVYQGFSHQAKNVITMIMAMMSWQRAS